MRQTRHRSVEMVRRYIREGELLSSTCAWLAHLARAAGPLSRTRRPGWRVRPVWWPSWQALAGRAWLVVEAHTKSPSVFRRIVQIDLAIQVVLLAFSVDREARRLARRHSRHLHDGTGSVPPSAPVGINDGSEHHDANAISISYTDTSICISHWTPSIRTCAKPGALPANIDERPRLRPAYRVDQQQRTHGRLDGADRPRPVRPRPLLTESRPRGVWLASGA
jgi:hypothetical protein